MIKHWPQKLGDASSTPTNGKISSGVFIYRRIIPPSPFIKKLLPRSSSPQEQLSKIQVHIFQHFSSFHIVTAADRAPEKFYKLTSLHIEAMQYVIDATLSKEVTVAI